MLACRMKDWKTVCKLASGPRCMHVVLCGRLGLCQDRRAVWEGADAAYLLYHQSNSASWRTHERSIRPHDPSVLVMIHIHDSDSQAQGELQ